LHFRRHPDDIAHALKDQAETGVLFELIARRYEYRSIAIAANQPFGGRDRIFPDNAMTVAAIDRVRPWARTNGALPPHWLTSSRHNPEDDRRKLPPTPAAPSNSAQDKPPATTTTDNRQPNQRSELKQKPQITPTPAASEPAKVVGAPAQTGRRATAGPTPRRCIPNGFHTDRWSGARWSHSDLRTEDKAPLPET